ncbi:dinitrogenase iron-molybdenum cofactor biosynthesis protein [Desulfocurvus sp. DL9XJH121]
MTKILITLDLDHVAARFDLTAEAWLGRLESGAEADGKTLVLSSASADELCKLVLTEKVSLVVCGAIEGKYYDYLQWKGVEVYDSVIGGLDSVLAALDSRTLEPGAVLDCPDDM